MNFKLPFMTVRKTLIYSILVGTIFGLGYLTGVKGFRAQATEFPKVTISRELPPDKQDVDFALFWKVWDTLHERYYDKSKLVPAKLVNGAIRGMVAAVEDPYTVFLPPSENKVIQEDLQGNFEGVGIQIGFKGTQLAVIAPLPDSPAEEAGIEAGDYIIGIKDEARGIDRGTVGITLPEAVEAIRGRAGTKVTLLLLREGVDEPIDVEITRKSINVPSVVLELVDDPSEGPGRIAHIKVLKFSGETFGEWEDAVSTILRNSDVDGIVLDVRNNPGGFLQGSVDLASEFLDKGNVVTIEEHGDGERSEYKVERVGRLRNRKVVVLINEGSASASEILAGALKDNKNFSLVGETSFGKGTIQEPQQINGGSGLHITIARWLTPKGTWVNEKGLTPDIEVVDNPDTEEDEQLKRAIEALSS